MFDAMLDIFGDISGPEVGGWMDKMAGWAGAGRFYVWTRSSPINLGQGMYGQGQVGGAEFFFQMLGYHEVCGSNLARGKFQNSNQLVSNFKSFVLLLQLPPSQRVCSYDLVTISDCVITKANFKPNWPLPFRDG